ncbi:hypothetical protein CYMTET_42271 [Cymbomonas tetramitiformis]|uniref:Uncharacterized protein n=1 Tax=Cymbomonas tetramitiformis TaxID=36881 RepID=A0AAE0F2S1_9CHLO|nr:hypothetical protein CYMTET_42271 [Cymbomonas tetramitiformis]
MSSGGRVSPSSSTTSPSAPWACASTGSTAGPSTRAWGASTSVVLRTTSPSVNKFTDSTADTAAVAPPPTTVAPVDAAPSVVSDDADQLCPMSAMHAHEPDLTFADIIAQLVGLSVTAEEPAFALINAC